MTATMAQPAHFAHILASSPFNEGNCKPHEATSSPPVDSPPSTAEVPRYFGESEYEDHKYSYSSPPSSVPSSGNSSFSHGFQPFPEYCPDATGYGYASSPLAHSMHHGYHLPPPPPPAMQQQQQQHHLPPTYHEYTMQMPQTAPRAAMIPGLAINHPAPEIHPDLADRPAGPKRRKTCPEIYTTSSSPTKAVAKGKRGAGKDGEDVWPTEVEVAFFECKWFCDTSGHAPRSSLFGLTFPIYESYSYPTST